MTAILQEVVNLKGTSGTGGTQNSQGGDMNLENSMQNPKNLTFDGETDRIVDMSTDKCINEDDLDKNGFYKE